ncbi:endonuclease VII domain-containing protein [Kitasatospora sp. NBC_01287]|uniref:endonuclease domain-containing protein n=1 Tax=Kitasatospora sp. NBC_01287 TaxID=2903573 RepID=UPI002250587F|nr:endonuclease domain-containing protein [Kitasatospora sp. NBC_01287]MCX4751734.1 endonuclease VII domain-containing protein [Kitasatospora sp. NBC_01287]MCX4751974.1 endonuclease VII domain-containing protein [Kitasatospora sp. NBC_01287]
MPAIHHRNCQHSAYRLTCEDFEAIWEHAGGKCEICRAAPTEERHGGLVIDHAGEYSYFAVRGLLCRKCNRLMGEVDSGRVKDERAYAYWENAWFVRVLRQRHAANIADRRARRWSTPVEGEDNPQD